MLTLSELVSKDLLVVAYDCSAKKSLNGQQLLAPGLVQHKVVHTYCIDVMNAQG